MELQSVKKRKHFWSEKILDSINNPAVERALVIFILLMASILVELFGFNYKHWTSLGNHPVKMPISGVYGMILQEDGSFYTIDGDKGIYFENMSMKIKNAYVRIVDSEKLNEDGGSILRVDFDARDESHKQYYSMNRRMIVSSQPRSYYVTFHFYGNADSLYLGLYPGNDRRLIVDILFNVVVPLFFRPERVLLIFAFMLLIYLLRPKSFLSRIKYSRLSVRNKLIVTILFFAFNALILLWANRLNPFYQSENGINTMQYQELAEAFSQGQISVLDEPCETLKQMENPYDMGARNQLMEFGEWYFDHAYYNGKYYVYFGVVPAVLLYWPYYILTGQHIHNHTVCYIGVLLILLGILLFYDEIIRRYFKKTSVTVWFAVTELTVLGSYIVYVTKRPDLYSVPIIYAVAFSILGIWAYLKALPLKSDTQKLGKPYLVAGSVFTALVAGCRPQIFLVVIIGVIILRAYAFNFHYLGSKDGILSLICVFVPMLVIGGLLMTYNALRFGSPFDFGAFYNLTFNDMRNRGWVWDRLPLGFSIYLLHPMNFVPEFPYFGNVFMDTRYMGETIQETTYGGIFVSSPFALFAFSSFLHAKKLKKKQTIWLISIAAVAIALAVMVFDTVNSGLLARYFFDFSFLWMMAAGLSVMNLLTIKEVKSTDVKNYIMWLLIALIIFEVIYQCMVFMLDSGDYLMGNRQDLFYKLYYLFGFAI